MAGALKRVSPRQAAVLVVLLAIALFVLPAVFSDYWVSVFTAVGVYTAVALSLGVLIGRVGLVSLGQIAVFALGSWVAAKLSFDTSLPFPLVLLVSGLVTAVLGTLVGLPALRLSGLALALITLMLAGAVTVLLTNTQFPNGGHGFLAHTENVSGSGALRRPALGESDPGYFRYVVVVVLALFGLVVLHLRSKAGRAWAAIRQSEASALAAGVNIVLYKLWALVLASFIAGVAGGLLAANAGKLFITQYPTSDSIVLLAVTLMGGAYTLWGALAAGALMRLLPALLDDWGLPADLLTILFGLGILQVLTTAPQGIAVQLPRDLARLGGLIVRPFRRGTPSAETSA